MSHDAPLDAHLDATLPTPTLYFPVASQGGVLPSRPLGGSAEAASCIEVDAERARYLASKRRVLQTPGRGPQRLGPELDAAIGDAERYLQARLAAHAFFQPRASELAGLALHALIAELQEDVVIMWLPNGFAPERARAGYLHVSFPAGWDPALMLGKSFPALHARVPREPGFERADQGPHAASLFAAPAERFVWSLTADDVLDRHPQTPRAASWADTTQLYLRVERQVSVPLPARPEAASALFFIRTYVYPVTRLDARQLADVSAAIAHMPAAIRAYKGMLGHERRIEQLLDAARAACGS
ncbi:MAG: heme-dependent oxidative N-demethylase subunit alpha family protein [Polyangiales bacterium]